MPTLSNISFLLSYITSLKVLSACRHITVDVPGALKDIGTIAMFAASWNQFFVEFVFFADSAEATD